jgi:energy-converting hydrogenase Eha subunit B
LTVSTLINSLESNILDPQVGFLARLFQGEIFGGPLCMGTIACILKTHSHSMSGGSIWASLECHCCFWIAGGLVSYLTMWLLTLQLFQNSIDTQGKLRLNLHSLSVSELLEYRRISLWLVSAYLYVFCVVLVQALICLFLWGESCK